MIKNRIDFYRELRQKMPALSAWIQSKYAVNDAKIVQEFEALESEGLVRLQVIPDEWVSIDDLEGDCFNPDANPDIPPSKLAKYRKEFIERVDNEGVLGIQGEYFDGHKWVEVDAVWGFIGDDWKTSGYAPDIMKSTLDAYRSLRCCLSCRQTIGVA